MARGDADEEETTQSVVARPRLRRRVLDTDTLSRLAGSDGVRSLSSGFVASTERWREQEREFIRNAVQGLRDAVRTYAASDAGWRDFLSLYAASPYYSPTNTLFVRAQFRAKGVPDEARFYSPSAWRRLGRAVKPEYVRPRSARNLGGWDDSCAAEILVPFLVPDPLDKAKANAEGRECRLVPRGYKTALVYHEQATEPADGTTPLVESEMIARGDLSAAEALWRDVELVCKSRGIKLEQSSAFAARAGDSGRWEPLSRRIRVAAAADPAERSAAALRALCESLERAHPADEQGRRLSRAAAESAKYVVASLYGIESDQQTFPFLAELSGDEKLLKRLTDETHHRVSEILRVVSPEIRLKAERAGASLRGESDSRRSRYAGKTASARRRHAARRSATVNDGS